MTQPVWKLVGNLGDVNPLDYGGFFVYVDTTGVYPPEVEVLQVDENEQDEDNNDNGHWTVYRFILEPCTFINWVLSDNRSHPDKPAWFATPESRKLDRPQDTCYFSGLCQFCDIEPEELVRLFCSDDPLERAQAWRTVGDYHGYDELDPDPLEFTSKLEVKMRYLEIPDDLRDRFEKFWYGYTQCLCFVSCVDDEEGRGDSLFEGSGEFDINYQDAFEEALPFLSDGETDELLADSLGFFLEAEKLIEDEDGSDRDELAGTDFHFTRSGCGCGFWDGDWPKHGDELTRMAQVYGTLELSGVRDENGEITSAYLNH